MEMKDDVIRLLTRALATSQSRSCRRSKGQYALTNGRADAQTQGTEYERTAERLRGGPRGQGLSVFASKEPDGGHGHGYDDQNRVSFLGCSGLGFRVRF
jgi:hypothetical protein